VAGSVWWASHVRHRQKVRVLEQEQTLEQERTRIAQDIHDDLGASLTRIAMLSQSALDKTQPPAVEMNRIYATARAMTRTMDEIVWAINPRHDSLDSVAAYFAEFVEEYLNASGLKFRLEIPLDLPPRVITSELRHNLFLAFKEALNNIVKHAHASEVVVTLAVREKDFSILVEDNGSGFDMRMTTDGLPGSRRSARGNGLKNMRRRLEELGGHCHIESVLARGTRVSFEVNFPA
jgi:signal transduction histidine kinase